jgi:nucleoside-triphosphatase
MRVILTGEPYAGKSTVCRQLAENLRREGFSVGGVWTEAVDGDGGRTLVLHNVADDTTVTLAGEKLVTQGPRLGSLQFTPEGIYAGIKAIGRGASADLLIVDEIGTLELNVQGFFPILHMLRRAKHVLLVIRPELVARVSVLLSLKDDHELVLTTVENRNDVLRDLADRFGAAIARAKWS